MNITFLKMKKVTTGMTNGKCQFLNVGISSGLYTYVLLCSGRGFRHPKNWNRNFKDIKIQRCRKWTFSFSKLME